MHTFKSEWSVAFRQTVHKQENLSYIAPDKAAYCVFTQLLGPQNAIKYISVRTKTQ